MHFAKLWLPVALSVSLFACSKKEAPPPAGSAAGAAPVSGVVPITVNEKGFTPDTVTLKQNSQATLRFTRTTNETCADKVVFPELKLEKELPLNSPVDVPITTAEARTYSFECGMGMFKSKVVVR